jgi:hypothetical protein
MLLSQIQGQHFLGGENQALKETEKLFLETKKLSVSN